MTGQKTEVTDLMREGRSVFYVHRKFDEKGTKQESSMMFMYSGTDGPGSNGVRIILLKTVESLLVDVNM